MASPFDDLVKTKHLKPPRICIVGRGGVGKSTFCAGAPSPLFIQTEDGLGGIETPALPLCETFEQFDDYLYMVTTDKHPYKTIVIDSADWLEVLIHKHIAAKHEKSSIGEIGYQAGFNEAAATWARILKCLNQVRDKGCIPIFTAHDQMVTDHDPEYGDYTSHTLKMHKASRALLQEWADCILYAKQDVRVKKEDTGFGNTKGRVIGGANRVMHTSGSPSFVSKSRYALPETLPLEWAAFQEAYKEATKDIKGESK